MFPMTDVPGSGLGLLEYLHWTEDADMASIMAIWAGFSLDRASEPEAGLAPYIDQARQQVRVASSGRCGHAIHLGSTCDRSSLSSGARRHPAVPCEHRWAILSRSS